MSHEICRHFLVTLVIQKVEDSNPISRFRGFPCMARYLLVSNDPEANHGRPEPDAGHAMHPRHSRYRERVLSQLAAGASIDELLAVSELSDLGARAHRIAESPEGELIDDEASIRRLLDL